MDKLRLGQWGERLKTGGAQMGRMVSGKMKEILQSPTPESKMVDEATLETLEEANWGMNLRICALINSEEFSGSEIAKAIKKKISGKSAVSQRLSLDLLEACAMNCEKVFSEIASERVLDEMMRMIDNPMTDHSNRQRAMQLIRAWGESEDLAYLPVFHQTFMVRLLHINLLFLIVSVSFSLYKIESFSSKKVKRGSGLKMFPQNLHRDTICGILLLDQNSLFPMLCQIFIKYFKKLKYK